MIETPKSYEEVELERDAILAGLLHHFGPSAVKQVLDTLEESKAYVKKQRSEKAGALR